MHFRDLFSHGGPAEPDLSAPHRAPADAPPDFVMGVEDTFALQGSEDLVAVGFVRGAVHAGDAVYVSNFGDDDGDILLTTVLSIEKGRGRPAARAADCSAALRLAHAAKANVKCGTVLYTRGCAVRDVHNAYVGALRSALAHDPAFFVTRPAAGQALSATDCQMLLALQGSPPADGGAAPQTTPENTHRLVQLLCEKLLAADTLYCVFSRVTGEPYLFSRTESQGESWRTSPPRIQLFTKPCREVLSAPFSDGAYEVREVAKGEDGRGIGQFLGSAFYLDGACAASVNSASVTLEAGLLVPPPDWSGTPEIRRPVTNPALERWLLLMAQLDSPAAPEQQKLYTVYVSLMQQALLTAKLLVPMKHEGDIPPGDENGRTVLPQGLSISLATIHGKEGRPAVRMFTDWPRLNAGMGGGWEGMLSTAGEMIDRFDCAINLTANEKTGCYISRATYDAIPRRDAPAAP